MAKFKVGDKVAYYGKESAIYRQRGTVSDVSQIRGETFVTVDLDNGEEWGAPEKDWTFMNSRACNAKFKVGDKIISKSRRYMGAAKIIDETDDEYIVKFDGGARDMLDKDDVVAANSCRSRNAVVAKALNATRVARNGSIMFELAKKYIEKNDDFGGVIDILSQDENLMPFYDPSLWAGAMAKAKRYYDAGNKATPKQKKELVSMIAHLIANSRASSNACRTARNAGDRDMYEDAIRQAIVKCEAAIKYEPDADDYSDVTRLVKQAKDLLAKAYRAI